MLETVWQLHAAKDSEAVARFDTLFPVNLLCRLLTVCTTINLWPGQKFSILIPYHLHGSIRELCQLSWHKLLCSYNTFVVVIKLRIKLFNYMLDEGVIKLFNYMLDKGVIKLFNYMLDEGVIKLFNYMVD